MFTTGKAEAKILISVQPIIGPRTERSLAGPFFGINSCLPLSFFS